MRNCPEMVMEPRTGGITAFCSSAWRRELDSRNDQLRSTLTGRSSLPAWRGFLGCALTQGPRSCSVGLRTHRGLQITRKWSVPCGDNEGKAQVRMQGSCGCREGVEGSSGR